MAPLSPCISSMSLREVFGGSFGVPSGFVARFVAFDHIDSFFGVLHIGTGLLQVLALSQDVVLGRNFFVTRVLKQCLSLVEEHVKV